MKTKRYFLLSLLTIGSFFSTYGQSEAVEPKDLRVLRNIVTDNWLQSYLPNTNSEKYPIFLTYAEKTYILSDSTSSLKEIEIDSIGDFSAFKVKSFQIKKPGKAKIKMDYLKLKLKFTIKRFDPCQEWEVRTILGRKSGKWFPTFFILG